MCFSAEKAPWCDTLCVCTCVDPDLTCITKTCQPNAGNCWQDVVEWCGSFQPTTECNPQIAAVGAYTRRWAALLSCTAQRAFSASLLELPLGATDHTDGDPPPFFDLLGEARGDDPPHPSRLPLRQGIWPCDQWRWKKKSCSRQCLASTCVINGLERSRETRHDKNSRARWKTTVLLECSLFVNHTFNCKMQPVNWECAFKQCLSSVSIPASKYSCDIATHF